MEGYRSYIRKLVADIINGKKKYTDVSSFRDFFYVQYALLKMGRMSEVVEMGRIARARNLSRGIDLDKERNDVAK